MAKRNQKRDKTQRMKRNDEKGIGEGNSKYARKHRLQSKDIYSPNSPFKPDK